MSFETRLAYAKRKYLTPPPVLDNVEWCEQHYFISDKNRPGLYDSNFAPYQREPMLEYGNPKYNEFVWMFGSQTGKTLLLMMLQAVTIVNDPGEMMVVTHDPEYAKKFIKSRFNRMISDVKPLKKLVRAESRGPNGDSIFFKNFPGGSLQFVTPGGSGGQITGFPIRYGFGDEVSKWPNPDNGDPVALFRQRFATYEYTKIHKIILSSTPLDEGTCRITNLYEHTDRRIYEHSCVHCHEFFAPAWENVTWIDDNPDTAALVCPHCGGIHDDNQRLKGMRAGRWLKRNPSSRVAGFHMNAISSPFVRLSNLVEKWLKCLLDPMLKKQFVNEILALTYKDEGIAIDDLALHERAEPYGPDNIPNNAIYLTAGVDVQKDRLEAVIIAWAEEYENYSLGRFVVNGSPDAADTWEELHLVLQYPFTRQDGQRLKILVAGVDTGYHQKEVFKFCNKYARFGYLPVKGKGGATSYNAPIWGQKSKRRGIDRSYPVGTTKAKDLLLSWLGKHYDREKQRNPGVCHFSARCDEEYFLQLGSEKKTIEKIGGRSVEKWVRIKGRNAEVLDCTVYAIATLNHLTDNRVKNEINRLKKTVHEEKQPLTTENEPVKLPEPVKPVTITERIEASKKADRDEIKARYAKRYGKK